MMRPGLKTRPYVLKTRPYVLETRPYEPKTRPCVTPAGGLVLLQHVGRAGRFTQRRGELPGAQCLGLHLADGDVGFLDQVFE